MNPAYVVKRVPLETLSGPGAACDDVVRGGALNSGRLQGCRRSISHLSSRGKYIAGSFSRSSDDVRRLPFCSAQCSQQLRYKREIVASLRIGAFSEVPSSDQTLRGKRSSSEVDVPLGWCSPLMGLVVW